MCDISGYVRRTSEVRRTLPDAGAISVLALVPSGHKFAIRDVTQGAPIRRYGQVIGFAKQPIKIGELSGYAIKSRAKLHFPSIKEPVVRDVTLLVIFLTDGCVSFDTDLPNFFGPHLT